MLPPIAQAVTQSRALKLLIPNAFKEAEKGDISGFHYFKRLVGFAKGGMGRNWQEYSDCLSQNLVNYAFMRAKGIGEDAIHLSSTLKIMKY